MRKSTVKINKTTAIPKTFLNLSHFIGGVFLREKKPVYRGTMVYKITNGTNQINLKTFQLNFSVLMKNKRDVKTKESLYSSARRLLC